MFEFRRTAATEFAITWREPGFPAIAGRSCISRLSNCDDFAGGFNGKGASKKVEIHRRRIEISLVGISSPRYTYDDLGPSCAEFGTCHREAGVAAPGRRKVSYCGCGAGQRSNRRASFCAFLTDLICRHATPRGIWIHVFRKHIARRCRIGAAGFIEHYSAYPARTSAANSGDGRWPTIQPAHAKPAGRSNCLVRVVRPRDSGDERRISRALRF